MKSNSMMRAMMTSAIDVYPWAAPTDEQQAWFDALSPEAKRKVILEAIEEGFKSPASMKSIDEIVKEAGAEL